MKTHSCPSRVAIATAVLTAVALTAGCGNRLPDSEFAGSEFPAGTSAAGTSAAGAAPAAQDTSGALAEPAKGAVEGVSTGALNPGGSVASGPAKPAAGGVAGTKGSGAPAKGGATASVPTVGGACTTSLSPIVLGQSGAFSGVIGAQLGGIRDGLAIWVQSVNASGGVQCHPIKLYALDDGSDPGRSAANWNDLVKNKKAIAIVGTAEPLTTAAYRSSAERDGIPIIGGDGSSPDFWRSPMMFTQGAEDLASYDIGQRYAGEATPGTDKVGMAYCVEASTCTAQKNNFPGATKRLGQEVGPIQAVSLTQPDYTAECQAMKSANVNAVWIMLDGSAMARFLRSCAALGYNPTAIAGVAAIGNPNSGNDANMRKNHVYMGGQVAPFMVTDTPGAKEFHAAIARYAPGLTVGQATMMGWTSGKLFEAALRAVAQKARAGEVTTALVLDGLYALKNEKLEGLSPGVSFVRGKPAVGTKCAFIVAIEDSGWTAPLGSKLECL